MGAYYNSVWFAECSRKDLQDKYDAHVDECKYNYGHSGYSGTHAEKDGKLRFLNEVCSSRQEADELIEAENEKWDPCTAVQVDELDGQGQLKTYWVVGGWCSS